MSDAMERSVVKPYGFNNESEKVLMIRDRIELLEVIRNHLDYTLRYEHRFHPYDLVNLNTTLNKLKLVIDMYNSKLEEGDSFWGLNKAFFQTFQWIEATFKEDLNNGDNRRISVLYIHFLEVHLGDLIQMYNEMLHNKPSLFHQMFSALMKKASPTT